MKRPDWLRKEKLYDIIFEADTPAGKSFDIVLMVAILLSLILAFIESLPAVVHNWKQALLILEYVLTFFFTVEYVARLYCSPRPRDYALSFYGIIDLVATLPLYLSFFLPGARYIMLLRTFRLMRVFRVFKLFSFLNEGYLLMTSLKKSLKKILVYFLFLLILVVCLGTLMYMIEGHRANSAFSDIGTSIYWAIVTMTTVGYGDITPATSLGKLLSAFIMLLGYTIIAIPTGIVSATFIDETNRHVRSGRCPRCDQKVHKGDRYCSFCGEKL